MAEIPWPQRGAFLAAATEALRFGEIVACDLADYRVGKLRIAKARQGARGRIAHTKNRSAEWRELWSEELIRWIEWRLAGAGPAEQLAGQALFWCPEARNAAKRWSYDPFQRQWRDACKAAGVPYIKPSEGTRHSTLTTLAQHLSERQLRSFSRHRSGKRLDHYATPKPSRDAIVKALPGRDG